MSASAKSRARAKLARFAARLGCADLSTLDRETLEQFSASELLKAASAAGLDVDAAMGRTELLARLAGLRALSSLPSTPPTLSPLANLEQMC